MCYLCVQVELNGLVVRNICHLDTREEALFHQRSGGLLCSSPPMEVLYGARIIFPSIYSCFQHPSEVL